MKLKRVLVTGAAGFIGSHLTDNLLDYKNHVFTVDNLSGGDINNVNPKSHFTQLDLTNTVRTQKYIDKVRPEIIFHLAADATEGRSQFTPLSSTQNNYLAYLNVLIPAIGNGLKKMILFSSMSVYGDQKPPFSEKMGTKPADIYGVAKAAMEKATIILSKVHKFNYVLIRPHNVYGPRQNMTDPYRNVIAIFINRLFDNKHIFIYGDGKQKRAFTYIEDCLPSIVKAGLGNFNNEIFNIGSTQTITINQLSNIILSHFPKLQSKKSMIKYLPFRPMEVKYAYCTNDKAERFLKYKEKTNIYKGLTESIKWARKKGHQPFKYLENLELTSKDTPKTWTEQLI